jgi:hypothetical protein
MGRRIGALVGMIVLLGLALLLMWHVYVHHSRGLIPEEPSVVSIRPLKVACALL